MALKESWQDLVVFCCVYQRCAHSWWFEGIPLRFVKVGGGRGWDPLKNPIKDPIFKKKSQSVPSKDPYKNPMMGPIKDLTFKVSYQRILLGMAFKDRLKESHQIPETEGQSIPIEGRRPVSGSQGSPPINQQSPISSPLAATFCPLTSTTVIDNQWKGLQIKDERGVHSAVAPCPPPLFSHPILPLAT